MNACQRVTIGMLAAASLAGMAAAPAHAGQVPTGVTTAQTRQQPERVTTTPPLAALAVPARANDCPRGWACLWEHSDYRGRMLKFRDSGSQDLAHFAGNFRDRTSSVWNRTDRMLWLTNVRTGQPDDQGHAWPGQAYRNLAGIPVQGRNYSWNDIIDRIKLG